MMYFSPLVDLVAKHILPKEPIGILVTLTLGDLSIMETLQTKKVVTRLIVLTRRGYVGTPKEVLDTDAGRRLSLEIRMKN